MKKILQDNRQFVDARGFEPFAATKFPKRKIAVVTCMDTRLVTLLPAALGIANGDVTMIKTAGGLVTSRYSDSMRSILVSIYELGVEKVMLIAHSHCGVEGLKWSHFKELMTERGIQEKTIDEIMESGTDLEFWLTGFEDTAKAVRESVALVSSHPLMPAGIEVKGFIIDTHTAVLHEVC